MRAMGAGENGREAQAAFVSMMVAPRRPAVPAAGSGGDRTLLRRVDLRWRSNAILASLVCDRRSHIAGAGG